MPYMTEGAMSAFMKVLSFIDNFSDASKANAARKNLRDISGLQRSSIMRASKDLVMSFPVICSDSIDPATAAMVSKAIERNCVTTLQMLFSANYLRGENGQDVLNKWHNNLNGPDYSMDRYLDMLDDAHLLGKSFIESSDLRRTPDFITNKYPRIEADMVLECKSNTTYYPISSFSESSIDTFEVYTDYSGNRVKRNILKEARSKQNKSKVVRDPSDDKRKTVEQFNADHADRVFNYNVDKDQKEYALRYQQTVDSEQEFRFRAREERKKAAAEAEKRRLEAKERVYQHLRDKKNDEFRTKEFEQKEKEFEYRQQQDMIRNTAEEERLRMARLDNSTDFFKKQLLDSDVRKYNELVPSMIVVRYNVASPSDAYGSAIESEFVAGVKTRLVPVSSEEIIDRMNVLFVNKPSKLNWIRATTGEISFMKDFVLGLDQAKIDAKRDSKLSKTSPIWRSLQHRSTKSGLNRLRKNRPNDAGAITTLVITQEEVDYLKNNYNIDLTNIAKANFVLEQYNFMGLVIVNETFEVARFLFDGGTYFEDLSFSSLERETSDSSYKKVVNLISKVNRG